MESPRTRHQIRPRPRTIMIRQAPQEAVTDTQLREPRQASAFWRMAFMGSFIIVTVCISATGARENYAAKKCRPAHDRLERPKEATIALRDRQSSTGGYRAGRTNSALGAHNGELDAIVLAELNRRRIPGGSVAVIRNGAIRYAKSFGLANVETAEPVALDTRFWIGSMGKQFTAMAVMMLVEQGRVALDDKVSNYLPQLPPSYDAVTVRHLLTHTSGMKRDFIRQSCPPYKTESMTGDVLFEALQAADPEFKPGAAVSYTNTGYSLLGMLIEKISGMTYRSFLTTQIFDPLEMNATQSIEPEDREITNLADGHDWQNGRYRVMRPALRFGGGTIISNVTDLAKWDAALYSEALVSHATLRQIWTPHRLNSGKIASLGHDDYGFQYKIGFGWFISDEPGNLIVHHGGGLDGNASYIDRYVDKKLTIIVLINREPTLKARAIARKVASNYGEVRNLGISE